MGRFPLTYEAALLLFRSYFDRTGGPNACHPWTGSLDNGYGQFQAVALGGKHRTHVLAWELANGPIPFDPKAGRKLDLDHTCHNEDRSCRGGPRCLHRRCGNLRHLIIKTRQQNLDAADEPRARGRFRTHFDCGCEITEENTYLIIRKGTRRGRPRTPERRCKKHERQKQQAAGIRVP
jgi:hypothetical protein